MSDRATLIAKGYQLLSYREHSVFELTEKLQKHCASQDLLIACIDEFIRHDLVNDKRFAMEYIFHKSKKGYGPRKIHFELSQHRIDASIVDMAFTESKINWLLVMEQWLMKKLGAFENLQSARQRQKAYRSLIQRGFEPESIGQVLKVVTHEKC